MQQPARPTEEKTPDRRLGRAIRGEVPGHGVPGGEQDEASLGGLQAFALKGIRLVGAQPRETLIMQINNSYAPLRHSGNQLDQRRVGPVFTSLIALVGASVLNR